MTTKRAELIRRLEPFAQGCFSGRVSEWPQLKPLLRDLYDFLSTEEKAATERCPEFFSHYPPGAGWDNPDQA